MRTILVVAVMLGVAAPLTASGQDGKDKKQQMGDAFNRALIHGEWSDADPKRTQPPCASLPRLQYLRLEDNRQLTNDCIRHLLRLEALVELQVQETAIDQHGLAQLVTLPDLQHICLEVWDGSCSFESLLDLSALMPRRRILAKGRGEFCAGTFDGEWRDQVIVEP
jgi:hypothetical protein